MSKKGHFWPLFEIIKFPGFLKSIIELSKIVKIDHFCRFLTKLWGQKRLLKKGVKIDHFLRPKIDHFLGPKSITFYSKTNIFESQYLDRRFIEKRS